MQELLGQDRALGVLEAAFVSQRVHHAFVFHGPVGVGKFTAARWFAGLLLCQQPSTGLTGRPQACGQCESCLLMARQEHPDFQVINRELARLSSQKHIRDRKLINIPAEVLREFLIGRVYHKARLGGRKVFVIDEADLIDARGQNILLKTLEEPPPGTHLILVTSSDQRLLVTVRSRCQRVGFGTLAQALIEARLNQHDVALTQPQRQWLIQFAAGSFGRLELALTYNLWDWAGPMVAGIESICQGRYPVGLGDDMQRMLKDFAEAWVQAQGPQASKEAANKFAATLLWTILGQQVQHHLHQAAQTVVGQPAWQAEMAVEPWIDALQAIEQAEAQLTANVHIAMVTENLVNLLYRSLNPAALPPAGMRT